VTHKVYAIFPAFGFLLLILAVIYPASMLLVKCFEALPPSEQNASEAAVGLPWSLLVRSVRLSGMGATLACVLSIPGIFLVVRAGAASRYVLVAGLMAVPLLFPPIVAALGWRWWVDVPGEVRCVGVWAAWCWPIVSLIVGGAWAKTGRHLYEVALMNSHTVPAFFHVMFSVLIRPLCAAWLLLFALFLGDYAVPHSCDIIVYATALLSEATSSLHPLATVRAAWPLLIPMSVALLAAFLTGRRAGQTEIDEPMQPRSLGRLVPALVAMLLLVSLALPITALLRKVDLVAALITTWKTYDTDILSSLGVASLAGVLIVWMGASVVAWPPLRRICPAIVLLWAVLPGALIGKGLIAAYLPFDFIYSHWTLTVLGYVARFGWIGVLCAYLVSMQGGRASEQAAMVDGASGGMATWRVTFANHWPTLAGGATIAAAMALAELATTSLVRVPSYTPVSLILIEKFHRFEDDILVALCILMLIAACPAIIVAAIAVRRSR